MKRRSLIVNGIPISIGTSLPEEAAASLAKLRQSPIPARHLGVHETVWSALADRASSVLPDVEGMFCGERSSTGKYHFQLKEAEKTARECSWSLHAEVTSVLDTTAFRAVLLCSARLATCAGQLAVLRVKGVASAGGVGLYHCEGNAGAALLLLPTPDVTPMLFGLALNE